MAGKKEPELFDFVYKGANSKGEKVEGELSAKTLATAKDLLKGQGITVSSVSKKSIFSLSGKKPIKPEDITSFCRQMSTMLIAGIPVAQALAIIGEGYQKTPMASLCQKIRFDVESGGSFCAAIKKNPQYFDNLVCSLIESGELSGTLDHMMDRIAFYKEKSDSLRRKIKKAMYYPLAVVFIAVIVTLILLIKVVPTFRDLFESYGAELPGFTVFVLQISDLIQNFGLYLIVLFIAGSVVIRNLYRRNDPFRHMMERVWLKLPIFGNILQKTIIARFARTLSTTSAAGVPLTDALEAVSIASNNIVYYNAIQAIKEGLSTGEQMKVAIKKTGVFPIVVVQMIGIGEESGALEDMLGKVATIFEEEVDSAVDGLTTLLEPLIMLVLGVVVGGLVVAMYLPVFKMGAIL